MERLSSRKVCWPSHYIWPPVVFGPQSFWPVRTCSANSYRLMFQRGSKYFSKIWTGGSEHFKIFGSRRSTFGGVEICRDEPYRKKSFFLVLQILSIWYCVLLYSECLLVDVPLNMHVTSSIDTLLCMSYPCVCELAEHGLSWAAAGSAVLQPRDQEMKTGTE